MGRLLTREWFINFWKVRIKVRGYGQVRLTHLMITGSDTMAAVCPLLVVEFSYVSLSLFRLPLHFSMCGYA